MTSDQPPHLVAHPESAPARPRATPEGIQPGKHYNLRVGSEIISGIVDAVMPDNTCFWIWADGGKGRLMIITSEATVVGPETCD